MGTDIAALSALQCSRKDALSANPADNDDLENVFTMQGGCGEASYARNSKGQAKHLRSMQPLLEEALNRMELPPPRQSEFFTIADLGCSSGENTVMIADVIVNHMTGRYSSLSAEDGVLPEFQVIFSDLPCNDFNTLFRQLLARKKSGRRPFYTAAVAGSFYRRLFPSRSINFVHSSFSLHWISRVPEVVRDRSSAAWNGGRISAHGASEATGKAYLAQFRADLWAFLQARSDEMRCGGRMFLVCLGRIAPEPADQGGAGALFCPHFEDAWHDLVQEGLIEEERRDSFNVPFFAPTEAEFREAVASEGSFRIDRTEIFRGGSPLVVNSEDDGNEVGRAFTNTVRSVCGVLVETHIGRELCGVLFRRLEMRATLHARQLVERLQFCHVVAVLTRKSETFVGCR